MENTPATWVPMGEAVFLDHVGAFVGDHRAAGRELRRLGFTLSPFARHVNTGGDGTQQPSGTGNQCVMLREGYLEVLSGTGEDTPLAQQLRAALARYEGLHLIAFAIADAAARHAALPADGFRPMPLVHLRRPLPGGPADQACRFDVVRLPPGVMPEGRIQLVTHHTPELVWRPGLVVHANGAEALTGILAGVDDPAEVALRFSRFAGAAARFEDPERSTLELARGRVTFVRPRRLRTLIPGGPVPCQPFLAAIGVMARDLDRVARCLANGEVPFERDGARLRVGPGHALGMTIVFHEAGAEPW